ncbi:MAG: FliH/SctL family protein, partial [Nitrospira sp.]|nr:FliH/SctL family protein [Nitrospira sp.]
IRVAASGQEAIAMVKQFPPALLIVDVTLPDRDGITVLEEALGIDNRIIGVAMTGAPTVELAVRAMKARASDFLIKPIRGEAVLMTVHRLLELYRLRGEQTVLKHTVIESGAVRLASLPLQTFGEEEAPQEDEGPKEFERGIEEGERRAEERCRREYAVLADIVQKFKLAHSLLRRTVEEDVVGLAFHIASKVLHETAETCMDQIVVQAKAALAAVQEPGVVVIQVHPDDAPALEAACADLGARRDLALTLKVEPIQALTRGSCLLHTHNRLIDASLDTQLRRLGEALNNRSRHES